MKKAIAKISTFVCVFLLTVLGTGFIMNQGNLDMTAQMGRATLPTVGILEQGREINLMRGYLEKMDTAGMREGITLLGPQREVNAVIHTYGRKVDAISFEVRSVDGGRLVEDTPVTSRTQNGSDISLSFRLKDLIAEGEEYSLLFRLTMDDGMQVNYYTRVVQAEYDLNRKLDFITQFSEATLDYARLQEGGFVRKLEPNADGDNSTLAHVTIHSSARQVAWAGLPVVRETEPEIQIREIAPQTVSAVLSYMVRYPYNEKDVFAWVEEYFRVRCVGENTYLLDYERTAEQLFSENVDSFSGNKISLGIADRDVELMENDSGSVFAFSQAGSLYSYNSADSRMARLFSFYDEEGNDARTLYPNHGYKILHVDETGNVTFLVYGYMNRGSHEGHCGVQICSYSSTLNVVEEMAFLPYDKSADILKAEIENLSYLNGAGNLYLMLGGSIFYLNLENRESIIVAENLSESNYRVADDGSMIVWQEDGGEFGGSSLAFMDLSTGRISRVDAGTGSRIRPLGFMKEDLIYGIASGADIREDSLGYTIFPMYSIRIRDFEGNILKNYQQEGIYVTDCHISGNQIHLERVERTETGYAQTEPDQILYSDLTQDGINQVETAVTEKVQTVVQIAMRSQADGKKVLFLTPREVLFEGSREIALEPGRLLERYYVYGKKGIVDIVSSSAEAAQIAHENAGAATATDGSYIYKRDRLHTANQIMAITGRTAEEGESSLSVCLDAILQLEGRAQDSLARLETGMDVMSILEEGLDDRRILSLQGCGLDTVLYYPDREIPVLAVLQDGSAVLITGFNEQNVVIMDPREGTVSKMGLNDAREWFAENGNRFMAYG